MRITKPLTSILIVLAFFSGCSNNESGLEGEWKAKWRTDPASYPGVDASVKFTMDGQFKFSPDGKVSISAYGDKGCIFGSDTLIHSVNWNLNNDTLKLVNENDAHGMTYSVLNLTADKMKLQLMEDIFLDLEKL